MVIQNGSRSVTPILWLTLFDHICLNVYIPVFTLVFFDLQSPFFAADTQVATRSFWYAVCLSLPKLGNLFFAPLLSALSDDYGRKNILIVGMVGALLFALIAALGIHYGSLNLLLVGALVEGILCRTNPIAQAAIGDVSTPQTKNKNMGYLLGAVCTGAFIGPIIGGYFIKHHLMGEPNFSLPFFIAAFFAVLALLVTVVYFRETLPQTRAASRMSLKNLQGFNNVIKNKYVLSISLFLFMTQVAWGMYYQSISPILKHTFAFTPTQLGLFMGMIAVWLSLTSFFGIKWIEIYFSAKKILFGSLILMLVGILLSLLACLYQMNLLIWFAALPIAIGDLITFVFLVTLYSNAVQPHEQGKVMGICFVIKTVTWGGASMLNGWLIGINFLLPLWIAPVTLLIAFTLTNLAMTNLPTQNINRLEPKKYEQ